MLKQLIEDQVKAILIGDSDQATSDKQNESPNIGKYCIIRCRDAGVHAGIVQYVNGRTVHLKNSRRMWRFWSASEHTLSAVSQLGLSDNGKSQLARQLNETIELLDACEILPCSSDAEASINEWRVHNEQ